MEYLQIIIEGLSLIHLVMMENTLGNLGKLRGVDRWYDLKDTLVNREFKLDV